MEGPIVIVDDDADDHELLKMACRKLGIMNEVRSFLGADEAIQWLMTTPKKPFIILCDLNMPVINGLQMREKIQASDYLRKKSIPFIFLSTAAVPDQVNKAYEMPIQGFFLKGNSMSDLEATLSMIFSYWGICVHPQLEK